MSLAEEAKQFDNRLLKKMLSDQEFTDVTLVTEDGKGINAHRVVLSACSHFFQQVFKRNPNPQTIIYMDNVSHQVLEGLIHFMYTGQVKIEKDGLKSFLKMGDKFKINGLLSEDENEASNNETITELVEPEVNISGEEDFILNDTSLVDNSAVHESLIELKVEKEKSIDVSTDEESVEKAKMQEIKDKEYYLKSDTLLQCDHCEYSSKFVHGLRNHKESVHELITHPCDVCDKKYTQKSHLYSHKRRVHEGIRYSCKYCDYTVSSSRQVKVHTANKHPEFC